MPTSFEFNSNCFSTFPILRTDRLTLRKIQPDDADRIFEMRQNSRNNEFLFRPNMEIVDSAKELIQQVETGYQEGNKIAWAGLLRDEKTIIGTCGFNHIDAQNMRAEIGGELFIDYWGKHLAFEAVEAIINYGFQGMNLHTIEAKVNPGNRGSIFLLEKLGFEREGYFKGYGYYQGEFLDLAVYGALNPNH